MKINGTKDGKKRRGKGRKVVTPIGGTKPSKMSGCAAT